MTALDSSTASGSLFAAIFSEETFLPAEPDSIEETGLSASVIEALICKYIQVVGAASGRQIADQICLPFRILESLFSSLRQRQILVHSSAAQMNDYNYMLTDQGRQRTTKLMESCSLCRTGACAAGRLHCLGGGSDDSRRGTQATHLAKAFEDISVDDGSVRATGAGHQFRGGAVSLRGTGQRQDDLGGTDHQLLRAEYLDPSYAGGRRPADQAVRCGLSPVGRDRTKRVC